MVATMGDILLSTFSGGSDGTTVSVFRQLGQRKQFRAHLALQVSNVQSSEDMTNSPILLCAHTCTRHLEQTIGAVVAANLHQNASVASYCVALLAEE